MSENTVTFGLKNTHYAPYSIVAGEIVFEKPIPFPGATAITLDPRGELVEFYADDMLYYSATNNQGYDSKITVAKMTEQFAIDALGEELDEEDGVINELADAKGKPFALLFEFDGDVKSTRHVLYSCTASRPSVGSSTKTSKAEPNTSELSLIASPIEIGGKRLVKSKTKTTTKPEIYANWYEEVYVKKEIVEV